MVTALGIFVHGDMKVLILRKLQSHRAAGDQSASYRVREISRVADPSGIIDVSVTDVIITSVTAQLLVFRCDPLLLRIMKLNVWLGVVDKFSII